ncbi:undecaprenyldiphospho-muramoylpentapeptide beta-N-acetylglucosaminyltransferase [Brevundimonas sp. S30B]|uniref:undecaprenyldiphospho-muramoylpentapeptide beta-N-acetylglucosaminyltransferase n=1 Tax=unclassified Brevundimonas TaxID=2622653 RepID=UPI001071D4CB|nr:MULTISPECIES: undecaprenyldiphospho-muramoylpentapeptide beta-N-acetylglucosaminyltransferase [unclassified Brevundimonas]QBX38705.1 undecaprenyldiphospho-muramoylpentapeptide beta-N-acetylglucosaminyltransferase [Brevundimonas sp. MF30-B]TFW01297.1 undecaprenyldiphospho-muramoylpentapeptide beta-N-acetylglucosaminyltransferase [Brevundimonas sp. S30B]
MSRLCVVAAGGTGGHMFPAEALAREMAARGWRVVLATDARGEAYAQGFPAEERLALDAATGLGPLGLVKAGLAIGRGVMQARDAFARLDADVVVGFGGYPSAPALVAAIVDRRPTLIHEQNAVLGRTNRTLAPFVTRVASAFATLEKAPDQVKSNATVTGNPVRADIAALAGRIYAAPDEGPIRVLVTGGSQGARLLSEAVPQALAALPEAIRARLEVSQQSRPETMQAASQTYLEAGVRAEVAPFFRDMAQRLGGAHLLIGRAGASTCSELAVTATPSLLIPLKIAMDDHQTLNARALSDAGAAEVLTEDEATLSALTQRLGALLSDPQRLKAMSDAARTAAHLDATQRLADLAESIAR